MVTRFGMLLGFMGYWAPEEKGSRPPCHLLSPCIPPSCSPDRSALSISWALMVRPRTTIPALLSLHVVTGPAAQRDCFNPPPPTWFYITQREPDWLSLAQVAIPSQVVMDKGGVTKYKSVFQRPITPVARGSDQAGSSQRSGCNCDMSRSPACVHTQ